MQKTIGKIIDVTSAAGGAISVSVPANPVLPAVGTGTTAISLESADALIVYLIAAGAAAPTGGLVVTAGDAKDNTATSPVASFQTFATLAIGASAVYSIGPGGTANCAVLPTKLTFAITAGAASTVRLVVYAVRF